MTSTMQHVFRDVQRDAVKFTNTREKRELQQIFETY
jgi:hypothetical protein